MNLRFIGTGSLGSFRIRNKLSRDYRRFSTLLIDEVLLIDPSEDIFEFEESFMLSGIYSGVEAVLITHSHLDHLSISALERLAAKRPITVYCDTAIAHMLLDVKNVSVSQIHPFLGFRIGEYEILPIPANHKTDIPKEIPYNFVIRRDKTIFYGLDGAWITPDALGILEELKPNAYVLECANTGDYSRECVLHNNLDMVFAIKSIVESAKAHSENSKFIISHIPTGKKHPTHEMLSLKTAEQGVRVAYDGYYLAI